MKLVIRKSTDTERLIDGCRKGRSSAQRRLYEKYAPAMLGICRRYLNDHELAEDVMIEGFMKIFNKIDQYRGEGAFEGWMRRIMVNESLIFIRRNKNMEVVDDLNEAAHVADYHTLEQSLHVDDLLELIDQLPQGYRVVFNLYAIEGYAHQEIAEKLGISQNTSKSQLSRARQWLQERLAGLEKMQNESIERISHDKA